MYNWNTWSKAWLHEVLIGLKTKVQNNLMNNMGFLETKSSVKAQSEEEMLETHGRGDNIKITGTELPSVNNTVNYSKDAIYLPLD